MKHTTMITDRRDALADLEDACEAVDRLLDRSCAVDPARRVAEIRRLDAALHAWAALVQDLAHDARSARPARGPWDAVESGSPLHPRSLEREIEHLVELGARPETPPDAWQASVRDLQLLVQLSVVALEDGSPP